MKKWGVTESGYWLTINGAMSTFYMGTGQQAADLARVINEHIEDAVAEEREAILNLGQRYGYDCCEEFKDAIRARGQADAQVQQ